MDASLTAAVGELGTSKAAARIRAAAIEVFAAKGYGATTTREIAASLDMSPGAVYPHYKTKESLLYAISLEGHHSVLAAITAADRPDVAAPDRLTSTVTAYVIWHADNRASARVAQYELRSLSPEHFAVIADIRQVHHEGVQANHRSRRNGRRLSSLRHRGRRAGNHVPRRRCQQVVPLPRLLRPTHYRGSLRRTCPSNGRVRRPATPRQAFLIRVAGLQDSRTVTEVGETCAEKQPAAASA